MAVILENYSVARALSNGIDHLLAFGIERESRNGPVLVAPGPVLTVSCNPNHRVLNSPMRDANPFFHLMEAVWMLAGRNDVAFPAYFVKKMADYSDDGKTLHGAYGHRWRSFFGADQLDRAVLLINKDPMTRQVVVAMWSAGSDFGRVGKDIPCNTHIYFRADLGKLDMTVCCRSNDALWGAHGANAVHFSMLHEYMAARTNFPLGTMYQLSNNYHWYTKVVPEEKMHVLAAELKETDLYCPRNGEDAPEPLLHQGEEMRAWHEDLEQFMTNPSHALHAPSSSWQTLFFRGTVVPMFWAWHERKDNFGSGRREAQEIVSPDWRRACVDWINRREERLEDI